MEKILVTVQGRPKLLSQAGSSQPHRCSFNTFFCAGNIASDGSQSSAGVFNERSHHHIGSVVAGLFRTDKFAVTVIYHANQVFFTAFDKANQFSNFLWAKALSVAIALGTLNFHQSGFIGNRIFNALIIKGAIRKQSYLFVAHTKFFQGAKGVSDSDNLIQGIVGLSYRG